MSTMSGIDPEVTAIVQSLIEQKRPTIENRKRLAAQELRSKKHELTTFENAKEECAVVSKQKENCIINLKSLGDSMEQTSLELNAESDGLREEIDVYTQDCDKLTDEFQRRSMELGDQFTSAPNQYAIEKIMGEIEMDTTEFEDFSYNIQSKLDPDIKASKRLMETEPFTLLEMPESATVELTPNTLDAIIANLDNNIKEHSKIIDQLENENVTLEEEEAIYGH